MAAVFHKPGVEALEAAAALEEEEMSYLVHFNRVIAIADAKCPSKIPERQPGSKFAFDQC